MAFLRVCRFAGFTIAVPKVVVDEIRGNYKKQLFAALNGLTKAERTVRRLVEHQAHSFDLSEECDKFEDYLDQLIEDMDIEVIPYPNVSSENLVRGGYSGTKPFKDNGEGFKDYLIWKSIIECLADNQDVHAFVTSNTSDFAKEKTKETFVVHQELSSDLAIEAQIVGFTGRQSVLDLYILPKLNGWTPWSEANISLDFQNYADDIIGKELPFKTLYGLEGLPFSNDVTITSYGEPTDLTVDYSLVDDDYMVRIRGESECLFDGFMDKYEYFSEYSDKLGGSDWNDHVVNVDAEATVMFEIMAVYDPNVGHLRGATMKILNEIESDYF